MGFIEISGKPAEIDGYDAKHPILIYPVLVESYDKLSDYSKFLTISKDLFPESDAPLLMILLSIHKQLQETPESMLDKMCKLFELVTRSSVGYMPDGKFVVNNENVIGEHNYDDIRKIIMQQNLIFEPKVYKNPLVQEWANKAIDARRKKNEKITIEDMITTVKSCQGITYEQIFKQTIYQLYADFYRMCKRMAFDKDCLFATVSDKITIKSFAENIDLYEEANPYKDLFRSSDILSQFNTALNSN